MLTCAAIRYLVWIATRPCLFILSYLLRIIKSQFQFLMRITWFVHGNVRQVRTTCVYTPRRRITALVMILIFSIVTMIVLNSNGSRLPREDRMEQKISEIQAHIQFLDALYRGREEDIMGLQGRALQNSRNASPERLLNRIYELAATINTPEVRALLKNVSGTKVAMGVDPNNRHLIKTPFVLQLLPHLMKDPYSLRPAFHMKARKTFADVVLGVPTVRRDKENYLMITLGHLVKGLAEDDANNTLIVVYIGECDLEYVLRTARQIEQMFPKQVATGLIEVISPAPSYYPNFEALAPTLGDSVKRFKWRTKQNLDTMYLMAYAQSRGTYYLMLEDDVVAKKDYMQDIKEFTAATSISNPSWFYIEYCTVGGIGKLFRSSDLLHFITYVQLFYNNLPIDWLMESYLADRVCTIDKTSKQCAKSKMTIRPRYKTSLFLHIGLYSSLKGKMQKVKDPHFGPIPTYYPHLNPLVATIRTDMEEHADHTLRRAYEGATFFWGMKPKKGSTAEFWFLEPTRLERFTFRSGNVEHVSDRFYDAVVEILPARGRSNFTQVGSFDEFGFADGILDRETGPLNAIRIRVTRESQFWVIISEIDLKPLGPRDAR